MAAPTAGNLLNGPRSLAVDPDGYVYVAGQYSDNVFKVTPLGATSPVGGTEELVVAAGRRAESGRCSARRGILRVVGVW